MFSHDWDDVYVPIHIDCIEQLVGIALAIVVFQHLNEMAAFNEGDDLLEADPSFLYEPGILVRVEGIFP